MKIEATQTYSPGNLELLIYLLNKLENKKINTTVYLGHNSVFERLNTFNFKFIRIIKSSALSTILRYLKKRKNVLFFCSFPPVVKNNNSLVYYHSSFFFNPFKYFNDKKISFKIKFTRLFVYSLIRFFNKNVDSFYCQSLSVKNQLKSAFRGINVKIMPFFNDSELKNLSYSKKNVFKYDFFYPATADAHKNFDRLYSAIAIISKERKISVCVTIDKKSLKYTKQIDEINKKLKYEAVVNLGRVDKKKVLDTFLLSKALIFPSLEESLGLPLIESAIISCPIIGSDLPFIYSVVENPIVFNPLDPKDIADKMKRFLDGEYENISQKNKINNRLDDIINTLNQN